MQALVVTVPADEVELASDELWALGVVAIEERTVADVADAVVELWTSLGDDVDVVTAAAADALARWPWRLVEIDESVADTWREFAEPIHLANDLVVCPAWVVFDAPPGVTVLRIEPGATFGLGDHPTTVLSLRAVRRSVVPGCSVLDVGCGSGVLAIGAARFGAARADGIDIAPASLQIVAGNAVANGVAEIVSVATTPLADLVERMPQAGPADGYDVVVANILAPTLIELAPHLMRAMSPDGTLVLSGLLAGRHDHVVAAMAPLRVVELDVLDDWVALTLRR